MKNKISKIDFVFQIKVLPLYPIIFSVDYLIWRDLHL